MHYYVCVLLGGLQGRLHLDLHTQACAIRSSQSFALLGIRMSHWRASVGLPLVRATSPRLVSHITSSNRGYKFLILWFTPNQRSIITSGSRRKSQFVFHYKSQSVFHYKFPIGGFCHWFALRAPTNWRFRSWFALRAPIGVQLQVSNRAPIGVPLQARFMAGLNRKSQLVSHYKFQVVVWQWVSRLQVPIDVPFQVPN